LEQKQVKIKYLFIWNEFEGGCAAFRTSPSTR